MIENRFDRIWKEIAALRPQLAAIMDQYGDLKLVDYIRQIQEYRPPAPFSERLAEFSRRIGSDVRRRYGEDIAEAAAERIRKVPVVSTGDHHGILSFPMFVHSNLMMCLDALVDNRDDYRIVLATGNVPLMNFTYPRGLMLTERNRKGKEVKIPLFPYKLERTWVSGAPPFKADAVERAVKKVDKLEREKVISGQKAETVRDFLQEDLADEQILGQPDYATQACRLNEQIWKRLFRKPPSAQLVPLPLEEAAGEWLADILEEERDLPLVHLLLDKRWQAKAAGLFEDVPGCWSLDSRSGSFLLWAIGTRGQPVDLWEDDGELTGQDPSTKEEIRYQLNAKLLADKLRSGELVPGLLVTFAILTFHFGIRCYGGFMQTDYLDEMKNGWIGLLKSFGLEEEAAAVSALPIANYLTGPSIGFVEHNGYVTGAGTFDLISRGGLSSEELKAAADHTIRQLNTPSLPVIYRIIKGADADPHLAESNPKQAIEHGGLEDLILS